MRLPNPDRAFVDPAKVRDYLLSLEHPVGRFKAAVFHSVGYSRHDWHVLHAELLAAARVEVRLQAESPFGRKYAGSAILQGPAGRTLPVTVVWFVRHGESFPRLVTVFPSER